MTWEPAPEDVECPNDCIRFGGKVPGHTRGSNWDWVPCGVCNGTMRVPTPPEECRACGGDGVRHPESRPEPCMACGGTGTVTPENVEPSVWPEPPEHQIEGIT